MQCIDLSHAPVGVSKINDRIIADALPEEEY